MRLGFALPQFGELAHRPDTVARFASLVEELGADSLWVGDRVLGAVAPVVGYGGGSTFPPEFRAVLDPLALLTVAATATRRVRLGSNVLVAPFYSPVLLARALTTIDLLSGGRLVAGFGAGWSPDEYQAVGVPWSGRGARLDECLDVLEKMWTANPVEHRGDIWTIPATYVDLKPAQRPRPPIYLGAVSPIALRRVGRRADGWLAAGLIPHRFEPAMFAERLATIRRSAVQSGRDPDRVHVILRANVPAGTPLPVVVEHLRAVERETGIGDAFVDLMYLVTSVDQALDVAGRLLEQLGGRTAETHGQ